MDQIKSIKTKFTVLGVVSVPLLLLVTSVLNIPLILLAMKKASGNAEAGMDSITLSLSGGTIFIALILTILAELLTIFIAIKIVQGLKEWRELLLVKNFSIKTFLIGVGIGVLLFISLQIVSIILNYFNLSAESSNTSVELNSLPGLYRLLTLLLFVPIIVPFVEELFFRGYVLNFIRLGRGSEKKATITAVILSTLYFSLLHFQGLSSLTDVFILIWTGLIGLINAFLVIKYDSIYPAFGVHAAYNGIGSLLMLIFV